jgi:GNAT superfamily N-acetyltransferase
VDVTIEPLAREHERGLFDCGEPALNDFLARFARQNQERGISRTFVAIRPASQRILGFYTISAGGVAFDEWPDDLQRKLPRHPVPVVTLGRLAVDLSMHGEGLGRLLLVDVMSQVLALAERIGIFALVVSAKNDTARAFYLKNGFHPFPGEPMHLFLTVATIRKAFGSG